MTEPRRRLIHERHVSFGRPAMESDRRGRRASVAVASARPARAVRGRFPPHEPSADLLALAESIGVTYDPYRGQKVVLSRRKQADLNLDTPIERSSLRPEKKPRADARSSLPVGLSPTMGEVVGRLDEGGTWHRGVVDSVTRCVDADADATLGATKGCFHCHLPTLSVFSDRIGIKKNTSTLRETLRRDDHRGDPN